jgi:hypothetical protein
VNDTSKEIGALRWGETYWWAANAIWPFVTLRASKNSLRIDLSVLDLRRCQFEFALSDLRALHKKRGLFSGGLLVEHNRSDCPPFILFWTFKFSTLKARMNQLGYGVFNK